MTLAIAVRRREFWREGYRGRREERARSDDWRKYSRGGLHNRKLLSLLAIIIGKYANDECSESSAVYNFPLMLG